MAHQTFRRSAMSIFLSCVFSLSIDGTASGQSTNIEITNTALQTSVRRLGINLGDQTYWDSGQMTKNLLFRNPGFEGMTFNSVFQCGAVTPASCQDNNEHSAWPADFWTGATYEFISGGAKGRTGTVLSSSAPTPGISGAGAVLALSGTAPIPAANSYILVKKVYPGDPTAGWWPDVGGGSTMAPEYADLAPGTAGTQALRITAAGGGQTAKLSSYFDSMSGSTFVSLNGTYRLSFRAKGVGGRNRVQAGVQRIGVGTYLSSPVTLTSAWQTIDLPFNANETPGQAGTVEVSFDATGSNVLIDDVELVQVGTSAMNTTVFRDSVVDALQTFKPGVLRYMASGTALGSTLDDLITPPFGRKRAGYSSWSNRQEDVTVGLHEVLELCALVGADPWFVVPVAFSTAEMRGLIEYLSGASTTLYGARRAARGRVAPWTDAFSTIHLEFGNEAWNGIFKGASIEWPDAYGGRASDIFGAARASISFVPSRTDLIIGGQAVSPGRNGEILNYSSQHDTLAVAPYLMSQVDQYLTTEDLYGPLFAQPQMVSMTPGGYMLQNAQTARAATRPARLAVYEVNLHTTLGNISQGALDQLTPSVGAGIAVAEHMLLMLRELGVRDQALFALPQFGFQRSDGKSVKLWGSVVDMGVTNRKRPQFLAAQLANEALSGDLVKTNHTGANPVWNQALSNDSVSLNGANYLQSFATANGDQHAVILINLHRTSALPVTFSGTAPSGSVVLRQLTSAKITDGNEATGLVNIVTRNMSSFSSTTPLSLPPYSMTVLQWTGTAGATPPAITGVGASSITANSATITWTTDKASSSVVNYGAGSMASTAAGAAATTTHSVPLTDLRPDTVYSFQVSSTDASNLMATSAVLTFRTLPAPPTTLNLTAASATPTVNSAAISWTTDRASSSVVTYSSTGKPPLTVVGPSGVTGHSLALNGLTADTIYTYRVSSTDALNISATSGTLTFRTLPSPVPMISGFSASLSGTVATFTWTTPIPATGAVTCTGSSTVSATVRTLSSGHSIAVALPTASTFACVAQSSADGQTSMSTTLSVTPVVSATGPVITNLSRWSIGSKSVTISWTTNVLATSLVQYGTSPALGQQASGRTTANGTSHQITLASLPNGAVIYYRAASSNTSGLTTYSDIQTVALLDQLGPVILARSATVSNAHTAVIDWTTGEPATGQIEYGKSSSFGSWSGGVSTLTTSHSITLTNLNSGTWYARIRTADSSGNLTLSPPIQFQVP